MNVTMKAHTRISPEYNAIHFYRFFKKPSSENNSFLLLGKIREVVGLPRRPQIEAAHHQTGPA